MNPVVKRVVLALLSLLLIVYVGVQGYLIFSASLDTVTADHEIAYETLKTTGVIYRSESVIREKTDGYVFYTVQDGNRVSKAGNIAHVFPSAKDAIAQQELETLDADIEALVSINAQGSTNRAGLNSINQQINETWLSISQSAHQAAYGDISQLHARLLTLLNKKQLTIGKEENFDERISQLRSERAALAASFNTATATVTSPIAGYFVGSADGFETVFTTDKVSSLTVGDIRAALTAEPVIDNTDFVGKIVGDYEWYLACVLPLESAATLKKDLQLEVCMPFVQSEPLKMKVISLNKAADDQVAVVLQCTYMSAALSTVRREQIEIRLTDHKGILVPDSAIYFNEQQEAGVFVQDGNILRFKRIQVLYHNETERYSVCAEKDDKSYLQLYDRIVTGGENLYDGKLVR